ncbi:MAG: homocysteine S-methyltransferase family protein [Pseudomonadota bacterium]
MTRYDRLMARVARGEKILIDGATGTEIEKRGVPQLDNAWNGGGALSHPEVLRAVHEDYIREGAEIVISNTFATHRRALIDAGAENDFEALNRDSVALAIEARNRTGAADVLVAGGISYWSWSGDWMAPEEIRTDAERQAAIMAAAGADLLMLEMMSDIAETIVTLEAALTAGLPVWVGLSCKFGSDGAPQLLRSGALSDAMEALQGYDIPLISIMHTEVEDVTACLDAVKQTWAGPLGVYAHSARWEGQVGIFDQTIPPLAYADYAKGWLDNGVQIIGGCCGLGVDHIRSLKPLVSE